MSDEVAQERFLGMTKFQFMGFMMIVLALLFAGTVYNLAFSVRANQARLNDIADNQERLDFLAERAAQDHLGLCAFIHDLDVRIDANREILRNNPGPIVFGIPRNVIEESVQNQGSTLNALRPINCNSE